MLIPILEEKKFYIDNNSNKAEFEKFILENKIEENSLIYIENYISQKGNNISFNNFTLYNAAKLEHLDEYFKKKFNPNYKNNDMILYNFNSSDKENFIFLKVIDIQEKYILGIDYFLNIFKLFKTTDKIKNIQDVYTIIFIKYFSKKIEDKFYILSLNEKSYIYIFENSFCDLFLNDLTVINLNFLDFSSVKNAFNRIRFDENNNYDLSFDITKNSEYIILYKKFNLINNYYSFSIKLINQMLKEMRIFQFILYFGLLNKVNCLINYTNQEAYGYEYFYYNYDYYLPEYQIINIEGKQYHLEISDSFNSKARKRFILLNYYDIENTKKYKLKTIVSRKKKNRDKKKGDQVDKNKIENIKSYDIKDFLCEEDGFPEKINETCFSFIFYHDKKKKENILLGIYDINEINDIKPIEKTLYQSKEEYSIFYDFYKIMSGKNHNIESKNMYFQSLNKYIGNIEIEKLVKNDLIDFSYINYKNYYIYINICLFYYYNKTSQKGGLIKEFKKQFNLIKESNLPFSDKIRIMRFTCLEYSRISHEDRVTHLYLLDELLDNNAYKIAINYNIDMINNLEENSKLYIPFLQLDSYILYNYMVNSNSYTLSLEPLIITKKHLLSSYDNFIFTCKEKNKNNQKTLAYQNCSNDVTTINEYYLFTKKETCDSEALAGNNYAIPISVNLLHERNGHSKKDKKNKRNLSPLYFYKKKKIIKVEKKYQKIDKLTNEVKGEAGNLVEYFIRYKGKNLVHELTFIHAFGNIINNVKYFTSKNFKDLAKEINENKNKVSIENSIIPQEHVKKNVLQDNSQTVLEKPDEEEKKEPSKDSLEYYEKNYLLNGEIFIYPYSIPVDYISVTSDGEEEKEISEGRKRYLEKYQDHIIEGRKRHYGLDYDD